MKFRTDSDTREFIDPDGDKLVVHRFPFQTDVTAVNELSRKAAFSAMKGLEEAGLDTKDLMKKGLAAAEGKSPEEVAKIAKNSAGAQEPLPVRRRRLEAIIAALFVNGEKIGGKAALDAYDKMDPASAKWVDDAVLEVWEAAVPSEAEKNSEGVDAQSPGLEAVNASA